MWRLPLERWEETLRANLTATFLTARGFLREVERNGHGSLVLIGSTAGLFGEAGHADYAAAKSAIIGGLLLSLKNEIVRVAPRGRVNAVCPGWTESPMTRTTLEDPGLVQRVTRTMPLRKVAQPEDVARQVVVLASDEVSGHVTGQVVTVAGGMEGRVLHSRNGEATGIPVHFASPVPPRHRLRCRQRPYELCSRGRPSCGTAKRQASLSTSPLLCRRKACRQSRANEGVGGSFGVSRRKS